VWRIKNGKAIQLQQHADTLRVARVIGAAGGGSGRRAA